MSVQMYAASEYFSCSDSALYSELSGLTEFSISWWMRADDLTRDLDLICWGPHSADQTGWLLWRDDQAGGGFNQTDTLSILTDDDLRGEAASSTINDGNFAHYCVTVQLGVSGGYHLYKNGVDVTDAQDSLSGYSALGNPAIPVRFGNVYPASGSNWFEGIMDDPRIYNRVLTPVEVQAIYTRRGTDGIVDGLVIRYDLLDKAPGQDMDGTSDEVRDAGPFGFDSTGDSGTAYATYRESAVLHGTRRRSA